MVAEFLPYIESALWVNLSSIFENMQALDHMEIKAALLSQFEILCMVILQYDLKVCTSGA